MMSYDYLLAEKACELTVAKKKKKKNYAFKINLWIVILL